MSAKAYCDTSSVHFSALAAQERFTQVDQLAIAIMDNISNVVPIVLSALMSEVLLEHANSWRSELELKTQCSIGTPIDISKSMLENALSSALTAMLGRGILDKKQNLYRINPAERELYEYYANSIKNWKYYI